MAGCKKAEQPAPTQSAKPLAYSENGWTGEERWEYYHLPEGSELMPYSVISNVVSVKTGKPFLENMERFGFIPDAKGPRNPYGMPVGLTVARSRSAESSGVEMVGFNCAACHVNELKYKGGSLRLDGAPALINLQGYQVEFKESLDATLKNPKKLVALVIAMERTKNPEDTPSAEAAGQYESDPAVTGAAAAKTAGDADRFHALPTKSADAAAAAGNPKKLGFLARLKLNITFLKARLDYLNNGKFIVDGTEPGPGRVDAFGAARNFLFPKFAVKMQSPVSFPFLWDVPDTTQQQSANRPVWIHYDGNTNSILERNIGQALGMGAVFDSKTFESTLRIGNLHRLEVLTHKLQPPHWPAELLGKVDEAKAKAGEQIFKEKCEGCHQDRLFPQMEVQTDPNRAASFGQPVGPGGKPFPDAIAPILSGLKNRAFQDDGIPAAEQAEMDANPVIWRTTGQSKARRLKAVWASAPYLHNGSVPTIYHLLHPEQRPAKFTVGGREYDPEKLGFLSDAAATGTNVWVFDTSKIGNSNIGHAGDKFGTNLPEEQKAALIEYLKTN